LARTELPGGGQIVIQGRYAYVGHQHRPDGTTILDISDRVFLAGRFKDDAEILLCHWQIEQLTARGCA
jgi:hypothetical protein